jgi:beta-lactamase regulating signal transducer with metallopeptidase domain/tetratricopeptide (TPR) repeat protein
VGYLPWLWLLGSPLTFALLAAGLVGAGRLRRRSTPVADASLLAMLNRLAATLGVTRQVQVAVSTHVTGPALAGLLRPLILLPPAALAGWSADELEMVLLHELAHVRRWDNLVNLLQRVVEALLFFHPVTWWLSRWVRLERECCCDAVVVAHTGRPLAYARTLAGFALAAGTPAVAAVGMAEHHVVTRIRRILHKEDRSMKLSRTAVGLAGLLLLAPVFLVVALTRDAGAAPAKEPPPKKDVEPARVAAVVADALKELKESKGDLPHRLLADAAVLQTKAGDGKGAHDTLEIAFGIVDDLPLSDRYAEYRHLAWAYARIGDRDRVIALAEKVPDDTGTPWAGKNLRATILQEGATEMARAGAAKDALDLAERSAKEDKGYDWVRGQVQEELAAALARGGKVDEALKVVERIESPASRVVALTGRFFLNYSFSEFPNQPGVALLQDEAGDKEGARKTLGRAAEIAAAVEEKDKGRDHALTALAMAQARLGDVDAAVKTGEKVKDARYARHLTAAVVRALAAAGKVKEARALADKVEDRAARVHALYHLGAGQARGGDLTGARSTFADAAELLKELNEEDRRGHAHNLATARAIAGDFDGALKTAEDFLDSHSIVFAGIAYEQAKAGDYRGALKTAAKYREGDWWQGNTLRAIAMAQSEAGDDKGALEWIGKLSTPHGRANALIGVAEGLAKRKK